MVQRCFNIVFSLCALVLFSPVLLFCVIWIKLDSKGPIFYLKDRCGLHGRTFLCYKFRTMVQNGDALLPDWFEKHPEDLVIWQVYKKIRGNDPRVTRAGKFLRQYSLDELPQFFNVLKGDMAVVGPRPYLPRELPEMGRKAEKIFSVRPGITGYWQVFGHNDTSFNRRLAMDLWYIKNKSFCLDARILLKTPFQMLA